MVWIWSLYNIWKTASTFNPLFLYLLSNLSIKFKKGIDYPELFFFLKKKTLISNLSVQNLTTAATLQQASFPEVINLAGLHCFHAPLLLHFHQPQPAFCSCHFPSPTDVGFPEPSEHFSPSFRCAPLSVIPFLLPLGFHSTDFLYLFSTLLCFMLSLFFTLPSNSSCVLAFLTSPRAMLTLMTPLASCDGQLTVSLIGSISFLNSRHIYIPGTQKVPLREAPKCLKLNQGSHPPPSLPCWILSTQLSYPDFWISLNPSISPTSSFLLYLHPYSAPHRHHHLWHSFKWSSACFPSKSIQWSPFFNLSQIPMAP